MGAPLKNLHGRARIGLVLGLAAAFASPASLRAQSPPDAGSVLRQIEQQRGNALPPESAPVFQPPAPMQSLGGATVTVRVFRFEGNTRLTGEELTRAVAGFVNRPLDFAELQNAAIAVANRYRHAGWVVRAYLPQQEIADDAVTIQVVEATLGAVRVEGESRRASAARLRKFVTAEQPAGAPLDVRALDRGLLLINDMPGVLANGSLTQGRSHAETDLVLALEDGPLVTGNVTLDDAGTRFTGAARIVASASLNGQLGVGDRADVLLLHSDGSDYQRIAYSQAVGSRGIRVGANASRLTYDIVTTDFSALDAHGTSSTIGLEASYPLLRARTRNLYVGLNAGERSFDNSTMGVTSSDYSIRNAALGLYGNSFDGFRGGGANNVSLVYVQGRVDLSGSPNELMDALTTRTAGRFDKLQFSASRLQSLTERVSLYASITGQRAGKNLDSSEKFYLGGSNGVRAYPQDEGGGAEGLLASLETRARLPARFTVIGFVDWGSVLINKDNDIPGAAARNRADFKGGGVTVGWTASFGLALKATISRRIGSNPLPTAAGNDQDGSLEKNRFWLQASMPF
jgi:hemolysin activation/secretion protein